MKKLKVKINKKAVAKFKKGYPLVKPEDLQEIFEDLPYEWVEFVEPSGAFLAYGYLAHQNKGIGWMISWDQTISQKLIQDLIQQAKERRAAYENDSLTTAYRLFNGEGDGFGGITIDRYDQYAVFSWYNQTIYQHRKEIIQAFQQVYPEIAGAYEKIRFEDQQLPESQKIWGNDAPEPLLVLENGVQYATYMNEGLMTGIFLDQKEVRGQLVGGLAAGRTVLNMFSYTGAFSVAAAMGGAERTTSVDLAKRSLEKTKEQFLVNQLPLSQQLIHVMDVFDYFKYAKRKQLTYDVIVLDPPSFARNKKKVFSVAKNYGDLILDAVDILKEEGMIIASTNAANIDLKRFKRNIFEALENKNVAYQLIQTFQLPEDFTVNESFPEGNYLKVLFLKIEK